MININNVLNLYKTNVKFKFYFDLVFVFILGQFLIGLFIISMGSSINWENRRIFFLLRNLISISYYVFSIITLYQSAKKIGKRTRSKTNLFLFFYILVSILITTLHNNIPYTFFSRLGDLFDIFYIQKGIDYTLSQNLEYILSLITTNS